MYTRRLSTKDEDCKDDPKTIKYDELMLDFWFQLAFASNKPVLAWMKENELNKFCSIVSEVSSFIDGNPVNMSQIFIHYYNQHNSDKLSPASMKYISYIYILCRVYWQG